MLVLISKCCLNVGNPFALMLCCCLYRLFLGLAWSTDDQSLKDAFSGFGEVTEGMFLHVYFC
jgi:hypothetical protein